MIKLTYSHTSKFLYYWKMINVLFILHNFNKVFSEIFIGEKVIL